MDIEVVAEELEIDENQLGRFVAKLIGRFKVCSCPAHSRAGPPELSCQGSVPPTRRRHFPACSSA